MRPPVAGSSPGNDPRPGRSLRANVLVVGVGVGLLGSATGVLMQMLTPWSRDAVVDADFVEITSPISGQLAALRVDPGMDIRAGEPMAHVQNHQISDGDVRRLRTALSSAEANRRRLEQERADQRRLLIEFIRDEGNQRRLDQNLRINELQQLRTDASRAREELAFSERDLRREEALFRVGAVADNRLDRARTTVRQNRENLQAAQARLRAQANRLQAAAWDINLDRPRSGTDPLPRLQETRLQLSRLDGELRAATLRVRGLAAELNTAATVYQQQTDLWLKAPISGVVWGVMARQGNSIRAQQAVIQLVNCQRRWVTTYVREMDLKHLKIGSRARIELIGEDMTLGGQVDMIQSGVGRFLSNHDNKESPPVNIAREGSVRVRIDSDMPKAPQKMCFVGYSARVNFL